jgi:hypothetical protein
LLPSQCFKKEGQSWRKRRNAHSSSRGTSKYSPHQTPYQMHWTAGRTLLMSLADMPLIGACTAMSPAQLPDHPAIQAMPHGPG